MGEEWLDFGESANVLSGFTGSWWGRGGGDGGGWNPEEGILKVMDDQPRKFQL